MARHIVILGAGVIGLTTGVSILENGHQDDRVTIVAEEMPGDVKSIKYTSAWAGAHHVSVIPDQRIAGFEAVTFRKFWEMAHSDGENRAPIMPIKQTEWFVGEQKDGEGPFLLENIMPDFKHLPLDGLPSDVKHAATFSTVTIDTPKYLTWLLRRFQSLGGELIRSHIPSLSTLIDGPLPTSAAPFPPTSPSDNKTASLHYSFPPAAIINCTGLGALTLGGVEDQNVFPTRGQTVLVRAPWLKDGITKSGNDIVAYVIARQSGDVILGGTRGENDWEPKPRPETALLIKQNALAMCPELLPPEKRAQGRVEDLDVIEDGVGLRPTRKGGIRLESETLESKNGVKVPVVHNYGHGGGGYQTSWGCAQKAVEVLQKALA